MTFTIAHLNLARGYRGGERQTELLIRGLAGKDINQVLIARPNGMLAPRISDLDVEVRPCIGLLSALMATRGTDLVHSHEGRGVYAAFARNLISGTPYVITRRVNNPLKRRWLTRLAYRRAVAVAGVSTEVANIVKRYDERIATCVVHSSSSHLPVDKDNAQSIRSLLPGKWIVGNVSALDNGQKGQEYIIEVAREFSVSHPDVGFMLVGGGDDEAMLRDLAGGLDNLVFTGWVDNVGDYLAAFDIFILPSNKEGIGGILLDAMDRSLPIVASRVGGVPEIVRDDEDGILIDPASPDQLADAILKLKADEHLRQRLGSRGRQIASGFTAELMASRYFEIYNRHCGGLR